MLFGKKQQVHPKLQAGDVVFFEPADLMGRLIQIVTFSKYTHVGIAVDSENMLEAQTTGVRIVPLSEALNRTQGKDCFPLSASARERFDANALRSFVSEVNGKPYDFYQALISGLHGISSKVKTRESEKRFFCSELVTDALFHCKVLHDLNSSQTNPHNLYNILKKFHII